MCIDQSRVDDEQFLIGPTARSLRVSSRTASDLKSTILTERSRRKKFVLLTTATYTIRFAPGNIKKFGKMAVSSEDVINTDLNDPVTKAVVDNIMGNLPTKKPLVRCEDCDLSFTSQTVLDTHLQGARHAKQLRSKNIMASLEETKIGFTKDEETNGLKCNVCNVCLNSIQQLQTHLNGSRHKKKLMRGGWDGKGVVSQGSSLASSTSNEPQPVKGPMKGVSLSCDICIKFFNSPIQYNMHMNSEKHAEKLRKVKNPNKKRFTPYWKKTKPYTTAKGEVQSLSNNFVSGGFTYQP